jgi:hypothetical protein
MAWFAPTYKYLLDPVEDLRRRLAAVTEHWNGTDRRLRLVSGGYIDFWSLETDEPARGRKYAGIVVDEAGMAPKLREQWRLNAPATARPTPSS